MLRVVADTNLFISALMFGGLPGFFLDLAFLRSFVLVTSPPLLEELDEKLRVKFGVSTPDAEAIQTRLERSALIVRPTAVLDVIKDDPDAIGSLNAPLQVKPTMLLAVTGTC